MNQIEVDREFMQLSRQFIRRVDAGGPRRCVNPLAAVAVVVLIEIVLVLAYAWFS